MLYIDDGKAGEHRAAFHNAAKRFLRMHGGESFYLVAFGKVGPRSFEMSARSHRDRQDTLLVVEPGMDPEEAILTALEKWWADRATGGTSRARAASS